MCKTRSDLISACAQIHKRTADEQGLNVFVTSEQCSYDVVGLSGRLLRFLYYSIEMFVSCPHGIQ